MNCPMYNLRQEIMRRRSDLDDEYQALAARAIADRIGKMRALQRANEARGACRWIDTVEILA